MSSQACSSANLQTKPSDQRIRIYKYPVFWFVAFWKLSSIQDKREMEPTFPEVPRFWIPSRIRSRHAPVLSWSRAVAGRVLGRCVAKIWTRRWEDQAQVFQWSLRLIYKYIYIHTHTCCTFWNSYGFESLCHTSCGIASLFAWGMLRRWRRQCCISFQVCVEPSIHTNGRPHHRWGITPCMCKYMLYTTCIYIYTQRLLGL